MREAAIIEDGAPVNVIVLADGDDGDLTLTQYAAMGIECVEITDVQPKPQLGVGWRYVDGVWFPPEPKPDPAPPGE